MTSILKSFRGAITGTLDTVTDVANTARETIGIGTQYVHHRAVAFQETDRESVLISTAETLLEHQSKLESNPNLAAIHKKLSEKWKW